MTIDMSTCIKFYKRPEIQEALVFYARNKEIAVRYGDGFGKRPDILAYPRDVLDLALQGTTSFHCGEEHWENPLMISSDMSKKELNAMRKGWDLVLDIDCKFVEYSKITADLIIKFLKYMGVKDYSCKFSGNKGFHIGVPFEAFPAMLGDRKTAELFPEAPRKIAAYIYASVRQKIAERILQLENGDFEQVKDKVELQFEDIVSYELNEYGDKVARLNVDKFLEIDTVLISSRHLYRMPYSFHEKSGLVSIPIVPEKVMNFEKPMAHPDKVFAVSLDFLRRDIEGESAKRLLVESYDFDAKNVLAKKKRDELKSLEMGEEDIKSPIREEFFPPCMREVLLGLEDGKKRAIFVLMNFLGKIGWSKEEITLYLKRWNLEKNSNPLPDNYVESQLRGFIAGDKLPPNCNNEGYYKAIGCCNPDRLCAKIQNPVNYTIVKWKSHLKEKEEQEKQEKRKRKKKVVSVESKKNVVNLENNNQDNLESKPIVIEDSEESISSDN